MRLFAGIIVSLLAGSALAEGGIGIAAVVDDQVISSVDLSDRIALVMSTTNIPNTPENRAHIEPQILRQLIDEKLEMEEAARDGISISDARLRQGLAEIEKQNGKEPGSLEQFVTEHGLSKLSLYSQIRAQLAWSEVVRKKVRPKVKISDLDIERYTRRSSPKHSAPQASAQPAAKMKEVLISVIHIPVDAPQREASVRKLAEKLSAEIRNGASFEGVASQFSSSASSARATPAFWVEVDQMDPAIAQALSQVPKGGVSNPVRTPTGYQILKLVDVRTAPDAQAEASPVTASTAPAAPEEPPAELAFKQILMTLKPDAKTKEAELLLQLAKEVQQSPGKCKDKSMAGAGDLADMDFRVTLTRALSTDLPEKLRDFLLHLKVGAASDPVITPQGVRIFMLCERIDLPNAAKTPVEHDDEARQAIYMEKIELEAQKYLRDMRREAFIEIRDQ